MRSATLTHKRCSWASVDGPMLLQYHDLEWGVPVHNEPQTPSRFWCSSGATSRIELVARAEKAGRLSAARFDKFDPEKVGALLPRGQIQKLKSDPAIIRNRMKIEGRQCATHAHSSKSRERVSGDFRLPTAWRFVGGRAQA